MGVSVESKLESLEYPDERGFSKGEIAGKSDGTALEVAGIDSTDHDHLSAREAWSIGWAGHAGTKMDAWLTSSCAQIGQVMLALPSALAKTGLIAGIPLMIVYGALSTWTIHNITALYVAMKRAKIQDGTWYLPGTTTRGKATQYYEVVAFHTNKWIGAFTLITTVIGLLSTGIAQVIACAANTYFIDDSHNKRYYAIIWGAVLSSVFVLIPTFKHFRLLSILGIVGTAWTAVYIWAASGIHGLGDNWQTGPTSLENFFLGLNVILNAFGGHGMSIEIMDSMYKPSKFDRVYPFSTLFTYIVTVPHSVLAVLAFGVLNVTKANVYAVLPNNAWRTVSIVLMLFHQCVAYSLYVTPVFFMAEKALGVHGGAYWKRILARAPVALLVWFFGVAFPFYGVINSFMGSYAGSLTAFILPASVYLWTFRSKTARKESLKQPPRIVKGNWFAANSLNILIILAFTVTGLGFGMWASVLSFIQNIQTLGVFAACYQCGKKH